MKCPSCGGAGLVSMVKGVPYTFREHTVEIEIQGDHCPECGEAVLNKEESEAFRAKIRKARDEIILKHTT
ncbi:type II toxin-antitoxin system MqsA family antitoxin [Pectobacterium brasiliense]|uniref:type II toxin-antitoxin system MqsA family antitoxin n=1 Tax=Pectobacterium brasiliense TaxID=180957 RepID=UPI003AFB1EEE